MFLLLHNLVRRNKAITLMILQEPNSLSAIFQLAWIRLMCKSSNWILKIKILITNFNVFKHILNYFTLSIILLFVPITMVLWLVIKWEVIELTRKSLFIECVVDVNVQSFKNVSDIFNILKLIFFSLKYNIKKFL